VKTAFVPGLRILLDQLRESLKAAPVSLATLPADLVRDWVTPDGRARIQVSPKGGVLTNAQLRQFSKAVRAVAPNATGMPISVQQSGATVVRAFVEAGILSFLAVTILLAIVLRNAREVLLTLVPLVMTVLLTLGTTVAVGLPLNYANIIALPLIFGIGVAFNIYFVVAWRSGVAHMLESSTSRAIVFSALTTSTAFGSLWLSPHPGTASMGELLAISLIWTLVTALFFLPALLGPPRETGSGGRPEKSL
jgi:predicted RND superfamily exporter protein